MADLIEELLLQAAELPRGRREERLAELCQEHPELAGDLRERFRWLERLAAAPADESEGLGEPFGDYRLLRQLGGGGMGVVYLARQEKSDLQRLVALKVVRHGSLFSAEARERFRREARAAMRLDHPAVCPVLDVGEVHGTPYIAMRHVQGETLAEKIAGARSAGQALVITTGGEDGDTQGRATTRERIGGILGAIEIVARVLHSAHEVGLVHRDVKPGNIMVTPEGDPVLLDFGLVQDETHGDEAGLTLSGQPLGTPAYMSPEQVRGHAVDHRTDVYSLGVTLYECLALQPAFSARTRDALYLSILRDDPVPLRRLDPHVSKDLAVVVAMAMQKDPRHRYDTALALAEDVRRLRAFEPIAAKPAGPLLRSWLWSRRNPVVTAFVAVLVVAAGLLLWQTKRLSQAEVDAVAQFHAARDAVEELVHTAAEELRDVPRVEHVRQRMLERALAFHERFLAERGDDPERRSDAARALLARGNLLRNLSRLEEAEPVLRRVVEELRALGTDAGVGDDAAYRLASALGGLAVVRDALGHPEDAVPILEEAASILAALPSGRQTAGHRQLRGQILDSLGASLVDASRTGEALEVLREAVSILQALAAEGVPDRRQSLPSARIDLAKTLGIRHEFEAADAQFAAAFAELSEAVPSNRTLGLLAFGRKMHGMQLRMRGRLLDARAEYRAALPVFERLAAENPETPRYAESLAGLQLALGNLCEEPAEAVELYRAALVAAEGLYAEFPANVEFGYQVAEAHYGIGNRLRRQDLVAAAAEFAAASAVLSPLVQAHPSHSKSRMLLGMALNNESVMHRENGDGERAAPLLKAAIDHKRALAEQHPEEPRYQQMLAQGLGNVAREHSIAGRLDWAYDLFDEALAIRLRLAAAHPDVVEYGAGVLVEYIRRVGYLNRDAAFDAQRWLESLPEGVLARYQTSPTFVERRRRILYAAAKVHALETRWARAHQVLTEVLALDPDYDDAQALMAEVQRALGR